MSALRIVYLSLLIGGLLHAQSPLETPAQLPGADSGTPTGKQDAVPEVGALRAAYDKAVAANEADRAKWTTGLDNWYLDGLGKLLADRTKAADLDGAVTVKAERDRLTTHTETTAGQIEAMPATLRTLRGNYDGARQKIADEIAKRNLAVSRKFVEDLEALQKRITVSGDLDRALLVKVEKERFAAQLASDTPAPTPLPPTPPATPATPSTPPPLIVLHKPRKSIAAATPAAPATAATPAPSIVLHKPRKSVTDATPAVASEGLNLLANANFENGTKEWRLIGFMAKGVALPKGTMAVDKEELHDGKPTLRIDNLEASHTFVRQTLTGKPYTRYRLTGLIQTKNVEPKSVEPADGGAKPGSGKMGAFLTVAQLKADLIPVIAGTKPWTEVAVEFATKESGEIQVGATLGTSVTGTAWFSDLSLVELGPSSKK